MRYLIIVLLLVSSATFADDLPELKVADPYLEMRTGPGSVYPVFYVVDRDEYVVLLTRKTNWFKVRTRKGKLGWVDRAQMEKTLTPAGVNPEFADASFSDFSSRRWELGVVGGTFNSAPVLTVYGGYALMSNLSAEISVSQVVGDYTSSQLLNLNLMSQPFHKWRYSPFFTLGFGQIETTTKATLIQAQDSSDLVGHVGLGVKVYLSRRFILRAEYKNYVGFSSDDNNEEFEEWKAGFAFFF